MQDYLIPMALSIILEAVKDPNKREKYRKALIKVRDTLNTMYPPER